jgi:hypothetical protein
VGLRKGDLIQVKAKIDNGKVFELDGKSLDKFMVQLDNDQELVKAALYGERLFLRITWQSTYTDRSFSLFGLREAMQGYLAECPPTQNSSSVDNTLEKLKQQLARQPGGGNSLASGTAALSADQRGAIGDYVRECWIKDAVAPNTGKQHVLLTVTTDANGVVQKVEVAGDDVARLSDPQFRAFAEQAIRAIQDPRCADLPLPNNMLGRVNVLTFRFIP